jgi:hypothetical protein
MSRRSGKKNHDTKNAMEKYSMPKSHREEERNRPLHDLLSISAAHVVDKMILKCNERYATPVL